MQSFKQHTESSLNNILDKISDSVFITDEDFKIQFLNASAEALVGWGSGEVQGKIFFDVIPIFNQQRSRLTALNCLDSFYFKNASLESKGKTELPINVSINPIEEEGRKLGFSIIIKNDKLDFGNNEKKYFELFENALEGILIIDQTGQVVDVNPKACEIFDVHRTNFLRLKILDIFPNTPPDRGDRMWKDFLRRGTFSGLYRYPIGNREVRYIEFKAKANYLPGFHLAVFNNVTEKCLVERSLKKSEANLKAIFNNSPQQILLLDLNYKIIIANTMAAKTLSEISERKVEKGSFICDFFFPEDKNFLEAVLTKVKQGEMVLKEAKLQGLGPFKWVEFSGVPVYDDNGRIGSIYLSINNITYRKAIEADRDNYIISLKASEKKFRSLTENSPDLIYIIDIAQKKVVYFNKTELLGYSSKFLEKSGGWLEIVHPDDIKRVQEHWAGFLNEASGTESVEYRLKRKNGDYEWVVNRHSIIEKDENENPLLVLLNITIITEQKKAEFALKESEARLTALIENTTDLVWSIDNDFNFTAMNNSFKSLFKQNFNTNIKVGENLLELLPENLKKEWIENHKKSLKGERFSVEFEGLSSNHNVYYEVSYNPIFSEESVVSGVSVFARDITLRKMAEQEIMQANFELDSFVYRASHDLRAPLRSILGLSHIIKNEQNASERSRYLSLIEKSINKLDKFIFDLINFSRNSRLDISASKIDFGTIVNESLENLKYMDNASLIDLRTEIQTEIPFYSDPDRIGIILQNLLSNSIKYISLRKEKPFVMIKVLTSEKMAKIEIIDNGRGIKEENIDKIFTMFFRDSLDSYGSGLGLYITKQVVEKLQGSIDVHSTYGEGTVFKICLNNFSNEEFKTIH